MSIALPTLSTALDLMGPAEVFVGDPMTASQMTNIGTLEGERRAEFDFAVRKMTLPEQTGDVAHSVRKQINAARIHCSIVLNASGIALWPKIAPNGTAGGGSTRFTAAVTTGVLLIPHSELGSALAYTGGQWVRTVGNGYAGATGSDAAPVHSVWLWKAHVMHANIPYNAEGKTMVDATWEAMLDVSKPDGAMVYYIGNPRAFSTAITVTL